MRLENKTAIVTGAGSGIGRATAIRFAAEGARVIVNDINAAGGEETVRRIKEAGGQGAFVEADVAERASVIKMVEAAVRTYGAPEILVNVAICSRDSIGENEWTPNVEVGLHGTWLCTQAVLPGMKVIGKGSIVNISSVNALMGFGNTHVYSGVKAGIIGLSRSLCGEVGKFGIRINCICPGTIVTEIWQPLIEQDPGIVDRLKALYPLRRLGTPEDIANAAVFLASDESSFATGAVFVIDGGVTAVHLGFPAFQGDSEVTSAE
jgi:NAD(P)-dependent dehydrogenase (short-subunit alcohol dehydrogenase family)